MAVIIKGQTKLTLVLNLGASISGASSAAIAYLKPDGTSGEFAATIDDASTGVISYEVASSTDIDEVGTWRFWAKITYADSKISYGLTNSVLVVNQGAI